MKHIPYAIRKAMKLAGLTPEAIAQVSQQLAPKPALKLSRSLIKRIELSLATNKVVVVTAKRVFTWSTWQARKDGGKRVAAFRHGPKPQV